MGSPSQSNTDRRLDSWKEIAAFFGRDERTVRRWEKENALPVHRIPGAAKGRVFAYESELRQWLSTAEAADPIRFGQESLEPISDAPSDQARPAAQLPGFRFARRWIAILALGAA